MKGSSEDLQPRMVQVIPCEVDVDMPAFTATVTYVHMGEIGPIDILVCKVRDFLRDVRKFFKVRKIL